MRGRKPKPTAAKRLAGNPGKRKLNAEEPALPMPADDAPPPPELSGDPVALAEWLRLAPMLRQARAITDGDRNSLVALCQQWSRYLEANRSVLAAGMVVRAPSGYPMPNPYIAIANRALLMCTKLWVELGLTPSARSRVKATGDSAQLGDPFAEFYEQPTGSRRAVN